MKYKSYRRSARKSKLSKRNQRSIAPLVGTVLGLGALGAVGYGGYKYFNGDKKNENIMTDDKFVRNKDKGVNERLNKYINEYEKLTRLCENSYDPPELLQCIVDLNRFSSDRKTLIGKLDRNKDKDEIARYESYIGLIPDVIENLKKKIEKISTGSTGIVEDDLSPVLPLDNSNTLSHLPQQIELIPEKIPDFIKYGTKQPEMIKIQKIQKMMAESNKRRISNDIELLEDEINRIRISNEIKLLEDKIDKINERLKDLMEIRKAAGVEDPAYVSTSNVIFKLHSELDGLRGDVTRLNSELKNQFGSKRRKSRRSRKIKTSHKKSRKVNKRRRSRK